jgi:hypothetical protein
VRALHHFLLGPWEPLKVIEGNEKKYTLEKWRTGKGGCIFYNGSALCFLLNVVAFSHEASRLS